MSDYKTHEFYSSEARRQVETTNALQSHLELKYRQFLARVENLPVEHSEQQLATLRGYKLALDELTHCAGITMAQLYGEQRRNAAGEPASRVVDDPAYEYAVSAYEDEVPTFVRGKLSEILDVQSKWRRAHHGANTLFRRRRVRELTPEALQQQLLLGKDYQVQTTMEAGPWEKL